MNTKINDVAAYFLIIGILLWTAVVAHIHLAALNKDLDDIIKQQVILTALEKQIAIKKAEKQ